MAKIQIIKGGGMFLSVQESNQKGKWGKLGLAKKRDMGGMCPIYKTRI